MMDFCKGHFSLYEKVYLFDLDLYFQGQIVFWKNKFSILFSIIAFEPCHMDVANVIEISHRTKKQTVEKKVTPPL